VEEETELSPDWSHVLSMSDVGVRAQGSVHQQVETREQVSVRG